MKRFFAIASLVCSMTLFAACQGTQAACAASLDASVFASAQAAMAARGGSGGGFSSGGTHSSSSGSSTGRSGGSGVKAPSSSGTHSLGPSGSSGVHAPSSSSSATHTATVGGKTYTYPSSIGRSYSYGGHTYVIHTHSFYHIGGFHDPYDPYDWTNYNNPLSPYYHVHLHC